VDIRHAGVTTDSRDDVVVTDRSVWCMDREGDVWRAIRWGDCDVLRRLLCVGLDVNQSVQLYDSRYGDSKSDVRPLLYRLIDEKYVYYRTEKVRVLLEAGVDVNVRVRYREDDSVLDSDSDEDSVLDSDSDEDSVLDSDSDEDSVLDSDSDEDSDESVLDRVRCREYGSVLDREGVSVLERTRRWVCQYSKYRDRVTEYKTMNVIKKRVRRYSI
jgi:hypothetical protein